MASYNGFAGLDADIPGRAEIMRNEAIRRRLIALEAKHPEKPFTLSFYELPSGKEETARTPEDRKKIEAQGGKLVGFDIHIPDKHEEGGYRHITWG